LPTPSFPEGTATAVCVVNPELGVVDGTAMIRVPITPADRTLKTAAMKADSAVTSAAPADPICVVHAMAAGVL